MALLTLLSFSYRGREGVGDKKRENSARFPCIAAIFISLEKTRTAQVCPVALLAASSLLQPCFLGSFSKNRLWPQEGKRMFTINSSSYFKFQKPCGTTLFLAGTRLSTCQDRPGAVTPAAPHLAGPTARGGKRDDDTHHFHTLVCARFLFKKILEFQNKTKLYSLKSRFPKPNNK